MPKQLLYLHIDKNIVPFNADDENILELKELLLSKVITSRIRMRTPINE